MGFLLSDIRVWLALATLLAIGGLAIEHQRAERYQTERDAATTENTRLVAAIESKEQLIIDLTSALQVWQDRATQGVQESTKAGDRAETYRTELNAARTRIRTLMEADRGSIDCLKLMAIDIAAVCPSTALGVRQWADDSLQRQNHPRPDTGDPANRPPVDTRLSPVE